MKNGFAAGTAATTLGRMFKGKPPRLGEVFQRYDSPVYFVTFCSGHRRPWLACDAVHRAFREYATRGCAHGIAVGRYVIMPDHLHAFVCGGRELDLGMWVRGLKRALGVGAAVPAAGGERTVTALPSGTAAATPLWQPGFFDHLLRSNESYAEKWEYVRQNPVRAGLVKRPEDWPYQGEIVVIDRV
ncbi:MAG: hypothetical protein WCS70_15405 [Verrucomicrobiota bacterium]